MRRVRCPICGREFASAGAAKWHMWRRHRVLGVSREEAEVIRYIEVAGTFFISDVASACGLDPSRVYNLIWRMVEKGLVVRAMNPVTGFYEYRAAGPIRYRVVE